MIIFVHAESLIWEYRWPTSRCSSTVVIVQSLPVTLNYVYIYFINLLFIKGPKSVIACVKRNKMQKMSDICISWIAFIVFIFEIAKTFNIFYPLKNYSSKNSPSGLNLFKCFSLTICYWYRILIPLGPWFLFERRGWRWRR